VERHRLGLGFVNIIDDLAVGSVNGVRFWREREIDGGLRERQMAFRRTKEIESILGGERNGKGTGFGQADIFTGHAHHAAREIERIFAGFEHAREPVKGGVGIGVADGFVQAEIRLKCSSPALS